MAVTTGILQPDSKDDIDDEGLLEGQTFSLEARTRMCLGLAWEEWLAKANPHISFHPGEFELDGLVGTPDGFSWPDQHSNHVLHEVKCTWKSRDKNPLDRIWMWMAQGKCYCKMTDTRFSLWHVYWVNGNYHPPSPDYRAYWIVYEQEEIDRNWNQILKHAVDRMGHRVPKKGKR